MGVRRQTPKRHSDRYSRRGKLDGRLAADGEVDGVRHVAFFVSNVMQGCGLIGTITSANDDAGPQDNLHESPRLRAVKHRAFRLIYIGKDRDAGIGIPACRIAEERGVG
jgi:hypothetical protein